MTSWYEGPLAAFGIGTTGDDAEEDRIVAAALVVQDRPDAPARASRWLITPGVPVPAAATGTHGLTEDQLRRDGRWPSPALEEMARALAGHCAAGTPLVVPDAPFALTVLDRELRRHRASGLTAWCTMGGAAAPRDLSGEPAGPPAGIRLPAARAPFGRSHPPPESDPPPPLTHRAVTRHLERPPLCVLDPLLLDSHLDQSRVGRRSLAELCARYGITPEGTPRTAGDARAALELARAVGRRFAVRMRRLNAAELHTLQAVWHTAGTRRPSAWYTGTGTEQAVGPGWPLRPGTRPAR